MSLIYLLLELLASAHGSSVRHLGSEEFERREEAANQLRAAGLWSVPALYRGATSRDAEVAFRSSRLIARWRSFWLDVHAAWVLFDPQQPDGQAFDGNIDLRERVRTVGIRYGLAESQVWGLRDHETGDLVGRWFQQRPYWADSFNALCEVRRVAFADKAEGEIEDDQP